MAYSKDLKAKVIGMRKKGDSINIIVKKTGLAKSTISLWVRNVSLPPHIRLKLHERQLKGWRKGHAAVRARMEFKHKARTTDAKRIVKRAANHPSKEFFQLVAALLYWCEGAKGRSAVKFANSDPRLVQAFLVAFRKGYALDETRLRALVHLHEYHNEEKQLKYWSKITNIPLKQFNKSYLKPHTGKRKKEGYPGCITITYSKADLVLDLESLYYTFAQHIEGM